MKKTLIALAVAGVVVAPAAMADVTVYGQAHISIGNENNGSKSYTAVNSNSSRFGIKAAESLDGGLTAVAQYEFGVQMDSNAPAQATDSTGAKIDGFVPGPNITARNQFVGLAGSFGTVLAGRHDAPIKMSTGALDIFADTVADYNGVVGAAGATDVRADNAIAYVAPAIAGATIVVAYVPALIDEGTAKAADVKVDATSAAVMWGQGPLSVDLGYLGTGKDVPTYGKIAATRVGVGYTVTDALKVAFVYDTTDYTPAGGSKHTVTDYLVNAAYAIGSGNTVKAEYGVVDPKGSTNNSTMMAVGLDHAFSKNTSAYVVYASMANDKGASSKLGGTGYGSPISPTAAGKDPSAIEVGMVVKF